MIPQELRNITAREFIRALTADGFSLHRSKGSHRIYKHDDGRRVTVAYHRPGGTFVRKTLAAMFTAAAWSKDDLRRLGLIS